MQLLKTALTVENASPANGLEHQMLPDSSRLLTVREVAVALRVSIPTVYRWIANEEMRAIRYGKPRAAGEAKRGGAIRIPESEVEVRLLLEPAAA